MKILRWPSSLSSHFTYLPTYFRCFSSSLLDFCPIQKATGIPSVSVFDFRPSTFKQKAKPDYAQNRSVNLELRFKFLDLPIAQDDLDPPTRDATPLEGGPQDHSIVKDWDQFVSASPEQRNGFKHRREVVGEAMATFIVGMTDNINNLLLETRAEDTYEAIKKVSPQLCKSIDEADEGFFRGLYQNGQNGYVLGHHEADFGVRPVVEKISEACEIPYSKIIVSSIDSDLLAVNLPPDVFIV